MVYYTNVGPRSGPLRYGGDPGAIAVLEVPDSLLPVGRAVPAGHDEHRNALWRLYFRAVELPGLFIVVDREFRPAEGGGRRSMLDAGRLEEPHGLSASDPVDEPGPSAGSI